MYKKVKLSISVEIEVHPDEFSDDDAYAILCESIEARKYPTGLYVIKATKEEKS